MTIKCSIYGLGVHVNLPLACLAGLPSADSIDVHIDIGMLPEGVDALKGLGFDEFYVSSDLDEHGTPEFRVSRIRDSGFIRMAYADGLVFVINGLGTQVKVSLPHDQRVEDVSACLLGPVMGVVLRLQGIVCLHASAVAVDGRAIALVGVSGAGKSTTAAAFARLGYPVLTDDVLALTDCISHFLVRPAYPRVRLWPQSVAGLFGSADALPRMMPGWNKRFLSLQQPGYRFQSEPLPLAALYFLVPRGKNKHVSAVEAVNPAEALMALVSDSFATNFQDKPRRAAEFDLLSRLVATISLRRISAPDDLARIDDLCSAIAQDVRIQCATAEAL